MKAIANQTKQDPKMPGQISKFFRKPVAKAKAENDNPASLQAILEKRRKDGYEVVLFTEKGRIK